MPCKICGTETEDHICLRCEKIICDSEIENYYETLIADMEVTR